MAAAGAPSSTGATTGSTEQIVDRPTQTTTRRTSVQLEAFMKEKVYDPRKLLYTGPDAAAVRASHVKDKKRHDREIKRLLRQDI